MKIIKSTLFNSRKCEYGNFELVPDKGWKLSYSFIDFESGLLIVSVSDENENNWEHFDRFARRIPSRKFVINLENLEILSPERWKKYFNYEKVILETDDKKFRLSTQRIHEAHTDSIHEELEFLETGLKQTSEGVAFSEKKRENLLESHLREMEEAKKARAEYEKKPNLDQFHLEKSNALKTNSKILFFHDDEHAYAFEHAENGFQLLKSTMTPGQWNPENMLFQFERRFETLELFIDWFFVEKWFVKYTIFGVKDSDGLELLTKAVTQKLNEVRKSHDFTQEEHNSMNSWQNNFWTDEIKKTEFKQFCPICYSEVSYYPRYPKYICNACNVDEKMNSDGHKISFSNIGFSGGLMIYIQDESGNVIKKEDNHYLYEFKMGNHVCTAQEARFGGVVIQLKA